MGIMVTVIIIIMVLLAELTSMKLIYSIKHFSRSIKYSLFIHLCNNSLKLLLGSNLVYKETGAQKSECTIQGQTASKEGSQCSLGS